MFFAKPTNNLCMRINTTYLSSSDFLVGALILLTYYVPAEIYSGLFFILILYLAVTTGVFVSESVKTVLMLWLGIFLCGAIFLHKNISIDVYKDGWYLLKTALCLMVGCVIGRKIQVERFLIIFVLINIAVAGWYVCNFVINGGDVSLEAAYAAGSIPVSVGLAVPVLLLYRGEFFSSSYFRLFAIIIIFCAILLTQSRTLIGCLLACFFISFGVADKITRIIIFTIAVAFASFAITAFLPEYDSGDISFFGKLSNSLNEISFEDGAAAEDMVKNWRGFESLQAQKSFNDANIFEKIVGRGMGATVDLGFYVEMGSEMVYRYLPMLHNGYYHVLVKYGILGLLMYLLIIIKIYNQGLKSMKMDLRISRLYICCAFVIMYTTLVVTGLLNKSGLDVLLIFLGIISSTKATQNNLS